ncbi:MAG TPA: SDR family oxidoreductase [Stellaceae bacterium]|nr:SDR family oxidoreductase [Stellaceae bacterium]
MNADLSLFDLTGKTAVVTGASSGCGVIFASALARAGATVVLAARREDRLAEVAAEIMREGGRAVAVRCDVCVPADIESVVGLATTIGGRVDIMVNNAGAHLGPGMMPEKITDDAAEGNVRVNLLGVWHGCKSAALRMLADGKGGSIINIGSAGGAGGWPDQAPLYSAAKAGIVNLTQTLAASWADRGVRVNALCLGFFPSEMAAHFLASPDGNAWARGHVPMNRVARMDELRGPILFLASEASSYVNGAVLAVDGGVTSTIGQRMPEPFYAALAALPDGLGQRIVPPVT